MYILFHAHGSITQRSAMLGSHCKGIHLTRARHKTIACAVCLAAQAEQASIANITRSFSSQACGNCIFLFQSERQSLKGISICMAEWCTQQ